MTWLIPIIVASLIAAWGGAAQAQQPKPPLHLTDQQRETIRNGVLTHHVAQPSPKNFQPKVGDTLPKAIKLDALPRPLVYEIEVLKQYDYAKLDRNLLIVDPMNKKIVDVIPRKSPASGAKPMAASDWYATRGRELIGLPPEASGTAAKP
jgi:hypothetical protein